MDTTVIAAIIGAIAAILAAIIGVLSNKRKVATDKQHFEKSKSLKLGYILGAIECYLEAQKLGITSSSLSAGIEMQSRRAYEIAKALGISTNPDANALLRDLLVVFDTKPIAVKKTFIIGYTIGRIYFFSISLMATGSLPPIDEDVERISEAEQLLKDAGLPSNFLKPVKNLWKEKLQAVREGDTSPIDDKMWEILDQLCKAIEIDARHIV